jgi:HrpA-like RNA helicase
MANLPLPLALARLLLFASVQPETLSTSITIAALLSNTKPLLIRGLGTRQMGIAIESLKKWFSIDYHWKSDLLMQVAIWNDFHYGKQGKANWQSSINHETLKTTRRSMKQIVDTMKSSKLLPQNYRYNTSLPTKKEIFPLLVSTLFAGLYPKIAYQSYSGLTTMPSLHKLPGLPREEAIHLRIHRNSAYTANSFSQGQFMVYHDIMGKEWMHGDTKKVAGDLSDVNVVLSTPIFIYGGALDYDVSLHSPCSHNLSDDSFRHRKIS